ncbi:MAG: HlyC/CorC family transporter [Ruminococcaceae bacterium]|nr:HlyC/CorC family transporter [Oscillospiraceae bacterium]
MIFTLDINIIYSIVIIILIAISAFCSCSETVYSCASTVRLKKWAEEGNKKAKRALGIVNNYDKTLTAILILNNIVNLSCSALATLLFLNISPNYGAALSTGVITLLVLTFGEIIPKCFGKEKCDKLALSISGILNVMTIVLTPLIFLFLQIKKLALKLFSIKGDDPTVTEDELKYIVEEIEEQGILEKQESEMVRSVLDFDETTVIEVLTPRVDVIALNIDDSQDKIMKVIKKHRFSRIPVYKDTIDNIVGILHTWDYLGALASSKKVNLKDHISPAQFIFQTQNLSSVLTEFRKKRLHMAVVTDEYGGTLGIVTMEDLLEEIVGEIWDEDEEIENTISKISDHKWKVDGDMLIDDMYELFDIKHDDEESECVTVGGFVSENLGAIPLKGDTIEYKNIMITVDSVTNKRIDTLTIELLNIKEDKNEDKND